ncbi:MAG: DUF2182 domain-containing protein [Thermomicrobiales bacterium]
MFNPVDDRRPILVLLVALVALAWVGLWVWGESPYGRYLSHEAIDHDDGNEVALPGLRLDGSGSVGSAAEERTVAALFVAGWTLMTVAMMLPSSLPLVGIFAGVTRRRADRPLLIGLLLAGYLGIWIGFGLLAHAGDRQVHAATHRWAWLDERAWLIGAATLIVAGLYQFTPLKHHCLDQCRSPLSFVMGHWRGRHERLHALWLGVHHGLFCIGCCWSLMLLMFAIGVGNLGWMLVLGAVMAAEKNLPQARRLSRPLGVVLLAWGALVIMRGQALGL